MRTVLSPLRRFYLRTGPPQQKLLSRCVQTSSYWVPRRNGPDEQEVALHASLANAVPSSTVAAIQTPAKSPAPSPAGTCFDWLEEFQLQVIATEDSKEEWEIQQRKLRDLKEQVMKRMRAGRK